MDVWRKLSAGAYRGSSCIKGKGGCLKGRQRGAPEAGSCQMPRQRQCDSGGAVRHPVQGHTRSRLFVATESAAQRDDRGGMKLQRSQLVDTGNESEKERETGDKRQAPSSAQAFASEDSRALHPPLAWSTIPRQNVSHLHTHTQPPHHRRSVIRTGPVGSAHVHPSLLRQSRWATLPPLLPELRYRKIRHCDSRMTLPSASPSRAALYRRNGRCQEGHPHMRRVAWMDASAASAADSAAVTPVAPTASIWICFWFGADKMPGLLDRANS